MAIQLITQQKLIEITTVKWVWTV